MQKPVIIYVSGAPGSGKTTLARLLSDQLSIPLISSDVIHGGVAFLNPEHDRSQTLKNIFVPVLIDMAQKGISLIADQVLIRGASETDIIEKLRPYATIVNIHTEASDPIERYISRIKNTTAPDVLRRQNELLRRATHHSKNLTLTSDPLDLNVPLLVVNTDDGYDPNLIDIISFIQLNRET